MRVLTQNIITTSDDTTSEADKRTQLKHQVVNIIKEGEFGINDFQFLKEINDSEFILQIIKENMGSAGFVIIEDLLREFEDEIINQDPNFMYQLIRENIASNKSAVRNNAVKVALYFKDRIKWDDNAGAVKFVKAILPGYSKEPHLILQCLYQFIGKISKGDLSTIEIDYLKKVIYPNVAMAISNHHVSKKSQSSGLELFTRYQDIEVMLNKLIKCDEATFKCDNLVPDLIEWIKLSEPEVQDLFKIASQVYWLNEKIINVCYSGNVVEPGFYKLSSNEIYIQGCYEFNREFFSFFVHELKHLLNNLVYQNNANPYKAGLPNVDIYNDNIYIPIKLNADITRIKASFIQNDSVFSSMFKIIMNILFNKTEKIIMLEAELGKAITIMESLYSKDQMHLELDVRLYQYLVKFSDNFPDDFFLKDEFINPENIVREFYLPISHEKFLADTCQYLNICLVDEDFNLKDEL